MKIRSVQTRTFSQPMIPLHSGLFAGKLDLVLTIVEADDGTQGYSLARSHGGQAGVVIANQITASLAARVAGVDPIDPAAAWDRMAAMEPAGYVSVFAISALDVAIWDLAGRLQGKPLATLVGGRRRAIQPYASSSHYPDIDGYLRDLESALAHGYTAYKTHPFYEPDADIALARALRQAAGPDVRLMLDAAKRYDLDGARRVGRVLDELGYHWYEEPLPQFDWSGYSRLRGELSLPVIGGETMPGLYHATACALEAGAFAAVLGDVYWKGGVTGLLRTIALCESRGIALVSHHGASASMNAANLHVLCGATDVEMIEVLYPEAPYEYGMSAYPRIAADGLLHLPEGPGLGITPDWAYIDANRSD